MIFSSFVFLFWFLPAFLLLYYPLPLRGKNLLLTLLSACVTINVYFPAAAAEKAADRIIREVWEQQNPDAAPDASEPNSALDLPVRHLAEAMVGRTLEFIAVANSDLVGARSRVRVGQRDGANHRDNEAGYCGPHRNGSNTQRVRLMLNRFIDAARGWGATNHPVRPRRAYAVPPALPSTRQPYGDSLGRDL